MPPGCPLTARTRMRCAGCSGRGRTGMISAPPKRRAAAEIRSASPSARKITVTSPPNFSTDAAARSHGSRPPAASTCADARALAGDRVPPPAFVERRVEENMVGEVAAGPRLVPRRLRRRDVGSDDPHPVRERRVCRTRQRQRARIRSGRGRARPAPPLPACSARRRRSRRRQPRRRGRPPCR